MDSDFYKAFEDRHRGSRDLIMSRLHVYLPFIDKLKEFYPEPQTIDLGCGRGEWLEVLRDHGVEGFGVDIDENMLSDCKALGLQVKAQDAISCLQNLPDESQVVVSAFHLVEHLDQSELRQLVKRALRVLKPAGLLILETPNPENITVGSSTFYMDPTHQRPIPPDLLTFICDYYGFGRTKVLRLQEFKEIIYSDNLSILDVLASVSPDYAIIAQKTGNSELLETMQDLFSKDYGVTLEQLGRRYDLQQNGAAQQLQQLQNQYQQLQGEHQQLQGEYQQLQGEYQQLQGEHQQLGNGQQKEKEHQHLQGQYQHLQGQYQHLQREYQSVSREMYDLKHGRLWYMTAPLRRVGDLERYLKKRFRQQVSKTDRLTGKEITMALRGSGLKPSQKEANEINSDFMLTPRAARILQDLKRATEKR
ncbi:MAG: methyltransferase domain-containing protein [Nodosilinea sp.]